MSCCSESATKRCAGGPSTSAQANGDASADTERCCAPAPQTNAPRSAASAPTASGCCAPATATTAPKCSGPSEACTPPEDKSADVTVVVDACEPGVPSGWVPLRLKVAGMTCTSCERALVAGMAALAHVRPVATSMFNNTADLVYDPTATLPDTIITALVQATNFEFAIEHAASANATRLRLLPALDKAPDEDAAAVAVRKAAGVTDVRLEHMRAGSTHTVLAVTFDPDVTGPRTLLELLDSLGVRAELDRGAGASAHGAAHDEATAWRRRLLVAAALTMPVVVFAYAVPNVPANVVVANGLHLWTILTGILTAPVYTYCAGPIHSGAWTALVRARRIEMDMLVSLSTSVAFVYSVVAVIVLAAVSGAKVEPVFETVALLVTLVVLGRYMTVVARGRAASAVAALRDLQPARARLVIAPAGDSAGECGEAVCEIDAVLMQRGDLISVLPSSRIPADGVVVRGTAEADESMITGEPLPVAKELGSPVIGGTVIVGGALTVRVTRVPAEGMLSSVQRLVEEAQASRAPVQALADRIAAVFTPAVVALAAVVFTVWLVVLLSGTQEALPHDQPPAVEALLYAIAVLVVSCPCAVGLAVPAVIVVATGVAARHGVLFRSGASLEMAAAVDTVVFDKTGTLTTGVFEVVSEVYACDGALDAGAAADRARVRTAVAAVASASEHPLARTIAGYLATATQQPMIAAVDDFITQPGLGAEGRVGGAVVRLGRLSWVTEGSVVPAHLRAAVDEAQHRGRSIVATSIDGELSAVFALCDALRDDAKETIKVLTAAGMEVHVLSGDHTAAARRVAIEIGVPEGNVIGDCLPADKLDRVRALQRAGGRVAFVGDGANDAPALAQAHVGVAFGSGTDLALAAAGVVLLAPHALGVANALHLARRARRTVAANFAWAFLYNVGAILLAAGAFMPLGGVRIPPALAGLGELASVLPVMMFAMTLQRFRWISAGRAFVEGEARALVKGGKSDQETDLLDKAC